MYRYLVMFDSLMTQLESFDVNHISTIQNTRGPLPSQLRTQTGTSALAYIPSIGEGIDPSRQRATHRSREPSPRGTMLTLTRGPALSIAAAAAIPATLAQSHGSGTTSERSPPSASRCESARRSSSSPRCCSDQSARSSEPRQPCPRSFSQCPSVRISLRCLHPSSLFRSQ